MPNRWTFQMEPVAAFLSRFCQPGQVIVDPCCGQSTIATVQNDLVRDGIDGVDFLFGLETGIADVVLLDPPYSPRQVAEHYREIDRVPTQQDTQSAAWMSRLKSEAARVVKVGGFVLTFCWNSGRVPECSLVEVLLVSHGGAHNDLICCAWRRNARQTRLL